MRTGKTATNPPAKKQSECK